jgi:hypothetical protein
VSVILSEAKDLRFLALKTKADSSFPWVAQNDNSKGYCANFWDAPPAGTSEFVNCYAVIDKPRFHPSEPSLAGDPDMGAPRDV